MATTIPFIERRKQRRFIVSGRVRFVTGFDSALASLVNLGRGGILIRNQAAYPEGTKGTFYVSPRGCPFKVEIDGEVVARREDLMAIRFLEDRPEISDCLEWLASENCPWTGTVTLGAPKSDFALPPVPRPIVAELEAAHALVFQRA